MTSPLQQIKKGILENNISLIKDGYELLTGEVIDLSNKKTLDKTKKTRGRPKKNIDDKKNIDNKEKENYEDVESFLDEIDDEVRSSKDIKFTGRFVDFGTRDDESNKIIYPRQRARSRPPARKVKQKCDDCGRIDELPPALARNDMLYYCNKCSRKKKGR